VKGFLGSAHDMLEVNGEIHVTHKTTEPYSKWEIERLAEDAGLRLVEKVRFKKADYPGFSNKRGSGPRADQTFSAGNSCTFKFSRNIT
jgi:25S rRNA (uracil2634-N3)-methyltransferase